MTFSSVIMDEKNVIKNGSSWDEWTIIDGKEADNNVGHEEAEKSVDDSDCTTAEEARETIQELQRESLEKEIGDDNAVVQDDESDGVSVISDKDGIEVIERRQPDLIERSDKVFPRIEVPVHIIIIACSVAVAVGFGIGCAVNMGKNRTDIRNEEMSQMPFEPLGEPRIVGRVIGAETAGIMSEVTDGISDSHGEIFYREEVNTNQARTPKPMNIRNFENIQSFKHVLDKVKSSLDNLWSMINETQGANPGNSHCNEISTINDLIELEDAAEYIISQLGFEEEVSNKRFKKNVRSKIGNLVKTFFNDLMRGIGNSLKKIHEDSKKMRWRLNKHICLLRNTMASDSKLTEFLQIRNISVEMCEKIVSASKKDKKPKSISDARSVEEFSTEHTDIRYKEFDEKRKSPKKERYIHDDEKLNDVANNKKYYKKKYKGETKRNFVGAHDSDHRDNMRKQIWPTFKKNKHAEIGEKNEKQKYGPVSPNGQVCYSKNSCSESFHKDSKIIREDGTADWQFKRAQSRRSQREESDGFSKHGWLYDRARVRESARHGF